MSELIPVFHDFLLAPITIYIWPNGTYEIPIFLGLSSWASLLAEYPQPVSEHVRTARSVWLRVLSISEGIDKLNGSINSQELVLTTTPKEITLALKPGSNHLILYNQFETAIEVGLQVEIRRLVDLNHFVERIPRNFDTLLDLGNLAISGNQSTRNDHTYVEVEVINERHDVIICPISLTEIKIAVKGKGCMHKRGFDARTYLVLAAKTNNWSCPICGHLVFPEDLVQLA